MKGVDLPDSGVCVSSMCITRLPCVKTKVQSLGVLGLDPKPQTQNLKA